MVISKRLFFYPNQVENNFINYFEIVFQEMKLLKYKLIKKKCYSYKKSKKYI